MGEWYALEAGGEDGGLRDAAMLNEAAIEGWMVVRLTMGQIEDGSALRLVARAVTSPWRRF